MKLWWRLAVAGLVSVWLCGVASVARTAAQAQITASPQGKKAGEFFKNVSTSTLKELSVDDFISDPDNDVEDWLQAEQELDEEQKRLPTSPRAATARR